MKKKTINSRFPILLAGTMVSLGFIINVIAETTLVFYLLESWDGVEFFRYMAEWKGWLFLPSWVIYGNFNQELELAFGYIAYNSYTIIESDYFLYGKFRAPVLVMFLSDIFIGGLQWYWIGRLILWIKRRIQAQPPQDAS